MRFMQDKKVQSKRVMSKKALEAMWWALLVIVLAIVIVLIFYAFIQSGILHIEKISFSIFSAPKNFSENMSNLSKT